MDQPFTKDVLIAAQNTLIALGQHFTDDFAFTLLCSSFLTGDGQKEKRRAICYLITNELRPHKECAFLHLEPIIKSHFQQAKLF